MLPPEFAIIIPAYKAEKELSLFLPDLLQKVDASQVLVINDGNTDKTEEVCLQFGIECITHPQNKGKGAALSTAFRAWSHKTEWLITMDADGQHSPNDLKQFIERAYMASPTTALIAGARTMKLSTMPPERIFSNRSTSSFLSFLTKQNITDSQCGYRAYRSSFLQQIKCSCNHFEMESEILIRLSKKGGSFQSTPIQTIYNGEVSHISHLKDTLRWIRAVLTTALTVKKEDYKR